MKYDFDTVVPRRWTDSLTMKKMNYKLLLTLVAMFISAASCFSQTVTYRYKPMKDYGCHVSYSVALQDSTYCIVVSVTSANMRFYDEPTMLLKTSDGEVLEFEGVNSDNLTKTSGNKYAVYTYVLSTAFFSATPEQFELLKKGVSKVRLSTFPIEHERTFKKDKIGKEIYKLYQVQLNRDDF